MQLITCMKQCNIAIQLRSYNLGESSGIVPQLLALGKSTIVSNIGSFREFGDAVRIVERELTADELSSTILDLHANPIDASKIKRYVEERRPSLFQKRLVEILHRDRADVPALTTQMSSKKVS